MNPLEIAEPPWPGMTIEEYANLERRLGTRLVKMEGVWWRRARPFFYRPLFPFAPLSADAPPPTPLARLGGWQHAVAEVRAADSHLNFMVLADPQGYYRPRSREDRDNLRRARRLSFRRLTSLAALVAEGRGLMREFFERTGYGFRRDRLRPGGLERWASGLLGEPRVLVLGAYLGERLVEVHVSFRVEDVLFFEESVSGREGRAARSTYGVLHYLRTQAAQIDVRLISLGPAGVKPSLDDFKLRRGASILSLPARLHLNSLARGLLRVASPATLRRLKGMDEACAARYSANLAAARRGAAPPPDPLQGEAPIPQPDLFSG